jgi:uncharacterized membrane protein YkvI
MVRFYLAGVIALCVLTAVFVVAITVLHPGDNTGLIAVVTGIITPVILALMSAVTHANLMEARRDVVEAKEGVKKATGQLEAVNENLNLNTEISAKALAVACPTPENKSLAVAAEKVRQQNGGSRLAISETGTAEVVKSGGANTNSEV